MSDDLKRELLRHTLSTLAYRGGKTLRDAPATFADFRAAEGVRTPLEILAHMGDVLDWGLSIAKGKQTWQNSTPLPWKQEVDRFFAALQAFDDYLADCLTHVGQIAILRRLAGAPTKGENYFVAEVSAGRVGLEQAAPKREF